MVSPYFWAHQKIIWTSLSTTYRVYTLITSLQQYRTFLKFMSSSLKTLYHMGIEDLLPLNYTSDTIVVRRSLESLYGPFHHRLCTWYHQMATKNLCHFKLPAAPVHISFNYKKTFLRSSVSIYSQYRYIKLNPGHHSKKNSLLVLACLYGL